MSAGEGVGPRGAGLVSEVFPSPEGALLLAASPWGLALCEYLDERSAEALLAEVPPRTSDGASLGESGARDHLETARTELGAYFEARLTRFVVPLDLRAGPFELAVWQALLRIPYGRITSYGAIAAQLGLPGAARAIGRANGRNRVAIIVPCHRVVSADGRLTGYGGGIDRKRRLLELEGALVKTP